jgi:hypothetical protein
VAHLLTVFKLLAIGVLGVLAAVLVVGLVCFLAPFVLAYFLFDRLCDSIEYFRPQRKRKTSRGDKLARIQKFLAFIPSAKSENHNQKG